MERNFWQQGNSVKVNSGEHLNLFLRNKGATVNFHREQGDMPPLGGHHCCLRCDIGVSQSDIGVLTFNIQVLNWTSRMNGWPLEVNPLRALGMVAKLEQNSKIKILIKTNNLIPNSTNLSPRQHCLPVNFNNFIFNSTFSSQHQPHQPLNFNIVISLKISRKNQPKENSLLLGKHLLFSKFQLPKTCQDQRLKIRVNTSKFVSTNCIRAGPFLPRESGENFVAWQDGGREWS